MLLSQQLFISITTFPDMEGCLCKSNGVVNLDRSERMRGRHAEKERESLDVLCCLKSDCFLETVLLILANEDLV